MKFFRVPGLAATAVLPCASVPDCADVTEIEEADLAVGWPPLVDAAFIAQIVIGEEIREESDLRGVSTDKISMLHVNGREIEAWILGKGENPNNFIC